MAPAAASICQAPDCRNTRTCKLPLAATKAVPSAQRRKRSVRVRRMPRDYSSIGLLWVPAPFELASRQPDFTLVSIDAQPWKAIRSSPSAG